MELNSERNTNLDLKGKKEKAKEYQLEQIFPKEFYNECDYIKFYILKVKKADTGHFVKNTELLGASLGAKLVSKYRNFKRVKSGGKKSPFNLILLFEVDRIQESIIKQNLESSELFQGKECWLETLDLPVTIPAFKEEEIRTSGVWSIIIKDSQLKKYTEKIKLTPGLVESINLVIKLANEARDEGNYRNACLLMDHATKSKILETAKDRTGGQETSIKHCYMDLLEKFGERNCRESSETHLGKRDDGGYYVCSGLTVIGFEEPCVMCSMALTHSRISKLIYIKKRSENPPSMLVGGCNQKTQIFCDTRLNHKFKVYQAANCPI